MRKELKRLRKRVKNWLIYVAVRAGMMWMRTVQRVTAQKFLSTLALWGFYLVKSERKKTIKNLTKVYGKKYSPDQIHQMGKEVFINLGKNMADAFCLSRFNAKNIDQFVSSSGLENLDAALEKGRGVIALTGHIGNWELMGAYLAIKGYPVNVVGAPIYDPRLDAMVVKNRVSSGMNYIARGNATREIIRVLRKNEIMGILIDQDTRKVDGVFVDFLGFPAYTPVGPVILAMKTGAAIVPMMVRLKKNGNHLIEIRPALEMSFTGDPERDRIENTRRCNQVLSEFILSHPTQWVWMHERWKTKPEDIKKRKSK